MNEEQYTPTPEDKDRLLSASGWIARKALQSASDKTQITEMFGWDESGSLVDVAMQMRSEAEQLRLAAEKAAADADVAEQAVKKITNHEDISEEEARALEMLTDKVRDAGDVQPNAFLSSNTTDTRTSWWPVDVWKVLFEDDIEDSMPTVFARDDNKFLFYEGKVNDIHGPSESNKSWVIQCACAEVLKQGQNVLYVDYESTKRDVVTRMLMLGVNPAVIVDNFYYISPSQPFYVSSTTERDLVTLLQAKQMKIAVFDGITEAMTIQGLNIRDESAVADFFNLLPRYVSEEYGPAVILIDHIGKSDEVGRFALGSQHKLAAITGVSYLAEKTEDFGRGKTGKVRLIVSKDREGFIREIQGADQCAAVVTLISDPDTGFVDYTVTAPQTPAGGASAAYRIYERPDDLERVSKVIEKAGAEGVKWSEVDVKGMRKQDACEMRNRLERGGYIKRESRPGSKAAFAVSLKPYRAGDELNDLGTNTHGL